MPQAVPFIASAIGAVAGSYVLQGVVYALLAKLLMRKPSTGAFPLNVTVRSTVAARRLLFGTVRAAGAMLWVRTAGSNNRYLYYVVAYAGHQCAAMKDLYLDKFKIASADINGSTGAVSTASLDGKLKVWDHLGTGAQTVDAELDSAFTEWTSNHRLGGICYSVIRFERSDDAFPTGAPESCNRVIDGMLYYDPRKDSTNGGSGSHRRDDPSTWEFGSIGHNPALGLRWFLSGGSVVNDQATRLIMYGLKESDIRILDSYTTATANLCEQSLSGGNAPPSGAQPRYTLNLEVACDQPRRDIIEEILATMGGGNLVCLHGQWRMYGAQYDAPSHTFTEQDLVGDGGIDIEDTTGDEDRKNNISAIFTDAGKDYTEQTSAVRTNSAYVTQDGGQNLFDEIDLRGVTDKYEAQRGAEINLRRRRQMRTVRIPFGRQGLKIAPWETFSFSHSHYGWTNRVFRCLVAREIEYTDKGGMICWVTAQAETSSIYTDLATADYTTGTSNTNALQSETPDAPTGLSAVASIRQIDFVWSVGTFWEQNGITELWENAVDNFATATRIWAGRGTRALIQKEDAVVRYYWVRLATKGGEVSSTEPATNGYAAASLRDPNIISDPNFELATDDRYWKLTNSDTSTGTPTGASIVLTGGVAGGVLQFVGDSTNKYAWNVRSAPFPIITGQAIRLRFRWRRTGTISSASGTDIVLQAYFMSSDGAITPAASVSGADVAVTRAAAQAVNVNEWQESEVTGTTSNLPKSGGQLPYLQVVVAMYAACTGGTIQVDQVQAHLN